jgi:HK97 family phage major capsid protein
MFNLKFVKMTNDLTPEQVVEKINTLFNEKTAGMPTHDDVNALKSEIENLKGFEKKSADMELALAKFEGRLEAMSEKAVAPKAMAYGSIGDQVVKAYAGQIEAIKEGKSINLETKETTIVGDYTGNIALSTLEAGVNRIARQVAKVRNAMSMGTTTSKFVTYIQQTLQSSATWIGEGVVKNEGDLKYQEVSVEVKKVAGFIKISKEMLEDLAFVRNEVNTDLMETIDNQIENNLLNGNGAGANLNGIINQAQAWSAGTFANTVTSANLADVVRTSVAQIETNKFIASHVVLHPRDVAKLSLSKTTAGEYTYGAFVVHPVTGDPIIAGLPIISTTWMTEGNFLVADMTRAQVRMREGMNIQVGYEGDDFKRNMVTILCEARLVSFIKANDTGAFVKGVIQTAIVALDPLI